jgi:hypothetical protein
MNEYEGSTLALVKYDSWYWVRRPFQYGEDNLDRGLLFKLSPRASKNEKLIRLGFCSEVPPIVIKDKRWSECGICQKRFLEMSQRNNHVAETHDGKGIKPIPTLDELSAADRERLLSAPLSMERKSSVGEGIGEYIRNGAEMTMAAPVDSAIEQREQHLDKIAPVYFENTEATRQSGDAAINIVTESISGQADVTYHTGKVAEDELAKPIRRRKKHKNKKKHAAKPPRDFLGASPNA